MIRPLRHIRVWAWRYDRWARMRQMHPVLSDEAHTCTNCGTEYEGRFCPQCGLKATNSRLTIKSLFQSFLDIWGLGSRPMFRTIGQLFTRPGYMIREYLLGHQPLYFPPFKMLVVVTVIFMSLAWLRGVDLSGSFNLTSIVRDNVELNKGLSENGVAIVSYIVKILEWFENHIVFAILAVQVFSVFATRIAFRKCKEKWTAVELFFMHIYMACQYYLLQCACVLLLGNDIAHAHYGFVFTWMALGYQWLTHTQLYNLDPWHSLWLCAKKAIYLFVLIAFTFSLVAFFIALI